MLDKSIDIECYILKNKKDKNFDYITSAKRFAEFIQDNECKVIKEDRDEQ